MTYEGTPQTCASEGCDETRPGHGWRDYTKRGGGWFEQKNGDTWCPKHIPEWVAEWRAKRSRNGN